MAKVVKFLVLAAGKGSRLTARGDSKPLVSLLGLTLIERAILAAQSCGLAEFYVVAGCNGEKVRAFLDKFSREKNLNITHVINEDCLHINISSPTVWNSYIYRLSHSGYPESGPCVRNQDRC